MGYIYCVGSTNSFGAGNDDLAVVKFAPNGTRLWNTTWGGSGDEHGYGIALDSAGYIYCVGFTDSFGAGFRDLVVVKFASNGTRLWNTTWGGSGDEIGNGIALDSAGYIYCVGFTDSFGAGNDDLAVVKFASNGTRLWNTTWGGSGYEHGYGVALDSAGYIYCAGSTSSFGTSFKDLAVVKFAPNGTRLWNTTWDCSESEDGFGIALDSTGYIYCIGSIFSFVSGNGDLVLVKFAPNGTRLWNTTWGGSGYDVGLGIALDSMGYIYCVGYTNSFGAGNDDFAVVKFTPNGIRLWNTMWGGSGDEHGYGIALDSANCLYCVGITTSFGAGSNDWVMIKFQVMEIPATIPCFNWNLLFIVLTAILMIKICDKLFSPKKQDSKRLFSFI